MKLNWGAGITISIVIFSIITLWFVYFAFNQEVNLVRDDYYEAEVSYNDRMETISRTKALDEQPKIKISSNIIEIQFPKVFLVSSINGDITLYRPSDRAKDITIPIQIDSSLVQTIMTDNLIRGMWKMQVDWNVDSISYFSEKILMVQ